jgi:putative ABC transport system substrate-binding protein
MGKVDIIVTGGIAVLAAKQATSVIPIVFAVANDPVGSGLVASLSRPGGNITGLSILAPDLAGKRYELLREVVPGLRRLAILANVGYPAAVLEMGETQKTALRLGLESIPSEIRRAEILRPPSRRSRAARMHFTSVPTRSKGDARQPAPERGMARPPE